MGANTSKSSSSVKNLNIKSASRPSSQESKYDDLVDLGAVFPNGLYTATEQDYDPRIVRNLIMARKIAPFYKGLPDAPETVVTEIEEELLSPPSTTTITLPLPQSSSSLSTISVKNNKPQGRPRSISFNKAMKDNKNNNTTHYDPFLERKKAYVEKMKQREKMLYNDAVECPICFLYYPANINYSRCCDQPICTECFVQIHRPIETPSIPATCPFCMQENYGVLYEPPLWSEKFQGRPRSSSHSTVSGTRHTTSGIGESDMPRRESVSHESPNVVLVDHIRPNWNKVTPPLSNAARVVSRRNSASAGTGGRGRISISTSSSSSNNNNSSSSGNQQSRGRNNLLRVAGVGSLLTRSGRSASSAAATEYNQFLSNMRDANMDLEDWMVMEAIRLSLAEQEERERKEAMMKQKNIKTEEERRIEGGENSSTKPTLSTTSSVQLCVQSPNGSSEGSSSSTTT
ncbi:uncharacterized protein BX663DRAFT_539747 [Cokeromyces recurvatus]|uniref:uncharacterized protein n=1 Tax=Cokeromyces recurvatus TaxID=90255 RepID=UPI0022210429|nr:uncharacterized protein BX663DRAFT_539747 [Cokeromyces recurvatus]KAI7906970.1 hypothetical protein BX663DRAFT_539747 [Cokeromyces recurvatus]